MKRLFLFILLAGFISCKKEAGNGPSTTIEAKNIFNLAYGSDAAQVMDLYLPAGRSADTTKLIVMIHGGAWLSGDKSEFNEAIPKIKQLFPGYAIANMNYRLATAFGNYFPTQENDVKGAIDFLLQKRNEYLFSDKLVLFGGSAGGHLATLQAYKYVNPKIKVVVDFFGPTDMVMLYNTTIDPTAKAGLQLLMSGTPTTNPQNYFSSTPLNYINAQSPPTIIFHGDQDVVVNIAHSQALKTKLQSSNVPNELWIYPGLGHDLWPDAIMNDALAKARNFVFTHIY